MSRTELPSHMKAMIARQHPTDAAARGIVVPGINDAATIAAAQRADIQLPASAPPSPVAPPNRHARREAVATWPEFAAYVRGKLSVVRGSLAIWLPGLQLRSENAAMKGESRGAKANRPAHARNFVQVRNCAAQEARCAFQQADLGGIGRFESPVDIEVLQVSEKRSIDPGNLFHKAVIDCLTTRTQGLGVIGDDSARYVSRVTIGYTSGPLVGVHVIIKEASTC